MKKSLLFFLIIIFQCFFNKTFAKSDRFDSLITKGINEIYNLEFEDAEVTFSTVENEFPEHPAGVFFDAMITWWEIMIDFSNEELDDIFLDKIENVIDKCDEVLDEDPQNVDALFFKGGSLGFRAKLNVFRENYVDAAFDGKDALPLVGEAYQVDSTNKDIQLGFGLYNYYAAVIPEKHPWVEPFMIFFPSGDKKLGLEQIKLTAEKGKYAKIESQYFLMTLYYFYEENFAKALEYANQLRLQFPNNPEFHKFNARIWIKAGNYVKGMDTYRDIIRKCNQNYRGYSTYLMRESNYYLGLGNWRTGKMDSAKVGFQKCEDISRIIDTKRESGFLVNAVLYQGMIHDLNNERDKAIAKYEEVLELDEFRESHTKAEQYLEKPYKK